MQTLWPTDDTRTTVIEIPSPNDIINRIPISQEITDLVSSSRESVADIIHWKDPRLLVIAWPCSIHDPIAAMEYARMLVQERERLNWELEIVMRVYFEKPRTTIGWKWLINDPHLDGTNDIVEWLYIARKLLIDIIKLWLPVAVEYLDVISPQYLWDLVTWWAIGARTTESQVHRELASWLSSPVGFKNGTDGNIRISIDAIEAARSPHSFLGTTKAWNVAIVESRWNPDTHIILRGGNDWPNYDSNSVEKTVQACEQRGIHSGVMVDFSHANSDKKYKEQLNVWADVADQIWKWNNHIIWVMIESNLEEGTQRHIPWETDPNELIYGQSITDWCIWVDDTLKLLALLADAVKRRNHINGIINPQ